MILRLLLALALATTASAAPLTAHVQLKNKAKWDVEIKGRNADLVSMIESGKTIEVSLPATDIVSIEFDLNLEKNNAVDLYYANDFKAAAAALQNVLSPTFPYLDITNRVAPYISVLLKSLYWSEQYDTVRKTADAVLLHLTEQPYRREAELWRALAFLESGRKSDAETALERIGDVPRTDENAAMYLYARACIQNANQQWDLARVSATQLVVFRPKDLEWLPAGLYLTAQCYVRSRAYETAEQTMQELKRFFPKSRWIALIPQLQLDLKKQREADEKAKAEREKEEARKRPYPIEKEKDPTP